MAQTLTGYSSFRWVAETLGLLLQRPARMQVAALCHRESENGPQVLLITSRNTKRWIIPKGWPMSNHSARKTARIEAYEEAGIVGKAGKHPIGEFSSHKGLGNGFKVRTNVVVFPLKAERQEEKFPEKGKRDLAWLSLDQAIERCKEPGLKAFLRSNEVKSLLMENK